MRFLILTQYFPPEVGAAQTRLMSVARELKQQGHSVEVVTAMPNYPGARVFPEYRGRWFLREELHGIPVLRTWIFPGGTGTPRRLLSYCSFSLSALVGCFAAARPDYLLVESPPLFLGVTGYVASRLRRVPFVLNVSDLWPASVRALGVMTGRLGLGAAESLERFLYRSAYRISAVTRGIYDTIATSVGDQSQMLFLPNGVDLSLFHPETSASDALVDGWIRPGEAAMLYAGTHGYVSGLDLILDAAELTRERKEVVFVFVGDGPEKARLLRLAEARGLDNVRFAPAQPLESMPAFFAAARAAIVPVRRAPLFKGTRPAKMFPAMACARPVIFCGEGESADLIQRSEAGLVVAPESPGELAKAVLTLADDPALAARLGASGRELVEREFGWVSIVDRWLRELQSAPVG